MSKPLTEKQQSILDFIQEFTRKNNIPPSIREIGDNFEISSLRGVTVHLEALQRKGYIKRTSAARGITVVKPRADAGEGGNISFIPFYSNPAGLGPDKIIEDAVIDGFVPVPQVMVRSSDDAFAITVRGDSMINAHILSRDMVIVKPQRTWKNGDLVAAVLGSEATVKYINETDEGVTLMPANSAHDPIPIRCENAYVLGKVIGLIRNYDGMTAYAA